MDLHLRGKLALVTGASKGIGRASARLLAEEGCDVILVARNRPALDVTIEEISLLTDSRVSGIVADLSDESSRRDVIAHAGDLDILVNNAGAIPGGHLQTVTDSIWRSAWELKVFGYINLCRIVYPIMTARGEGVIINVIGSAGERPDPAYIAGSTGNAGLMAFTRALGREAPRHGVRVVGINPGFTLTDRALTMLRDRAAHDLGNEGLWPELQAGLPFGRAADPNEIAAAVAFLASARSSYTSGTILSIDGGNA